MKRLSFLITAGPTREFIDPVRFLSNPSTGKMGYALAQAAHDAGHDVRLVSGPVQLPAPDGVYVIDVVSAAQMCEAVLSNLSRTDVLIMAAAVSDYYFPHIAGQKIKKSDTSLTIELCRTKDILHSVAQSDYRGMTVGFAAETHDLAKYALDKLHRKKLNLIVANDVTRKGAGFAAETNLVTLYSDKNDVISLPLMAKRDVAAHILEFIGQYIRSTHTVEQTEDTQKEH